MKTATGILTIAALAIAISGTTLTFSPSSAHAGSKDGTFSSDGGLGTTRITTSAPTGIRGR